MNIVPLKPRLIQYLKQHHIERQWKKQILLFSTNPRHSSLHTELLEPKHLHIYSFRITQQYRVIFIYCGNHTIEIVDINNHYQ